MGGTLSREPERVWPAVLTQTQVARLLDDPRLRIVRTVPAGITIREGRRGCVRYVFAGPVRRPYVDARGRRRYLTNDDEGHYARAPRC